MRRLLRRVPGASRIYQSLRAGARYAGFAWEYRRFAAAARSDGRFTIRWADRYPCLDERTTNTVFDTHYIYHTAWAARVLRRIAPAVHTDISSSLYFPAIVSAFVPVRFFDYRPPRLYLDSLEVDRANLNALPFPTDSVESLSCMHVVEHVGLGRYGDPIDPRGDVQAMGELARVVARGGSLLFVIPVGQPRIQYNAHRVYSYEQIVSTFAPLELVEFALIPDDAEKRGLLNDPDPAIVAQQRYACGCFHFRKSAHADSAI
jgi:SAM-dependent methyltransferase